MSEITYISFLLMKRYNASICLEYFESLDCYDNDRFLDFRIYISNRNSSVQSSHTGSYFSLRNYFKGENNPELGFNCSDDEFKEYLKRNGLEHIIDELNLESNLLCAVKSLPNDSNNISVCK